MGPESGSPTWPRRSKSRAGPARKGRPSTGSPRVYAEALLRVAEERGQAEDIGRELRALW